MAADTEVLKRLDAINSRLTTIEATISIFRGELNEKLNFMAENLLAPAERKQFGKINGKAVRTAPTR